MGVSIQGKMINSSICFHLLQSWWGNDGFIYIPVAAKRLVNITATPFCKSKDSTPSIPRLHVGPRKGPHPKGYDLGSRFSCKYQRMISRFEPVIYRSHENDLTLLQAPLPFCKYYVKRQLNLELQPIVIS